MIEANLPAELSLEEVSKIISDARATSTYPLSMGMRIFGALADNTTVSGDTLRQALSLSAITLTAPVSVLANAIDEVSKTGNLVKMSNTRNTEFTVADTKLRVLSQVACLVGERRICLL